MDKELKRLFEAGRLNELEEKLKEVDPKTLSPDDILDYMAFRALIDEKLYGVYWSEELDRLADIAQERADQREGLKIRAVIWRNKAQIIIRNPDIRNFLIAKDLLNCSHDIFKDLGLRAEVIFTRDEILRTEFRELLFLQEREGLKEYSDSIYLQHRAYDIYDKYVSLLYRFLELKDEEEVSIWLRNAILHFLEISSYFGFSRSGYGWKGFKMFWPDNKKKAIACLLYSFGKLGNKLVLKFS